MSMMRMIKTGTMSAKIEALRKRHRMLDDRIAVEHQRPLPDMSVLQRLKRHKLRLKDELERYEGVIRTLSRDRTAVREPVGGRERLGPG